MLVNSPPPGLAPGTGSGSLPGGPAARFSTAGGGVGRADSALAGPGQGAAGGQRGRGWGLGRRAYCGHAGVAPIALRERWGQCRPGPRDPFCYPSVSLSRGVEAPPHMQASPITAPPQKCPQIPQIWKWLVLVLKPTSGQCLPASTQTLTNWNKLRQNLRKPSGSRLRP